MALTEFVWPQLKGLVSMKLSQLFSKKECIFALEVFPPKKQSAVETVYGALQQLGEIPVDYISVTYSAGGLGAKEYTAQISHHLKNDLKIEPLAHLTCVNSHRNEIDHELQVLKEKGISNILALRGDRIEDAPPCRDFAHASDLVSAINAFGGFYVVGACYPEGHPESKSLAEDIGRLGVKIEAGVGHLVSQLFFDNGKYYRFMNLLRKNRIHCPVEAGVMPIVKPEQLKRTLQLSSASLPENFTQWVNKYQDDAESFYKAGVEYAIFQIRDLIQAGVDGVHLYAMNNPDVAHKVYDGIKDLLQ